MQVSGVLPYLFNESNKSLPVGHPLPLQVLLRGELIATQLQSYFKAVGVEVIEVLHAWKRKAYVPGECRAPLPLHSCVPGILVPVCLQPELLIVQLFLFILQVQPPSSMTA